METPFWGARVCTGQTLHAQERLTMCIGHPLCAQKSTHCVHRGALSTCTGHPLCAHNSTYCVQGRTDIHCVCRRTPGCWASPSAGYTFLFPARERKGAWSLSGSPATCAPECGCLPLPEGLSCPPGRLISRWQGQEPTYGLTCSMLTIFI